MQSLQNLRESIADDLRGAVRGLWKSPAFTIAAVVSLSLAIGANTAIFTLIDGLSLRTLRTSRPESIVLFRHDDGFPAPEYGRYTSFSFRDFQALRDRASGFADVAAIALLDRFNVGVAGGSVADATPTRVSLVSGSYFPLLGIRAERGRLLGRAEDDGVGGHPVAVISDEYWHRTLAAAPDALGHSIVINGSVFTIVGITPRGFTGDWVGRPTDIWVPITMQSAVMTEMPGLLTRSNGWLRIIGRLRPGTTIQQAQGSADAVFRQDRKNRIAPNATAAEIKSIDGERLELKPGKYGFSPQRESYGMSLTILMGLAALVLLTACANVGNLLLVRATTRRRQFAVQLALGAGRRRLMQRAMVESLVLAALGGILGVILAAWGTSAISTLSLGSVVLDARAPSSWVAFNFHPDLAVLGFTLAVCGGTVLLFGVWPAVRGTNVPVALTLRLRDMSGGGARTGPGSGLVVVQIAVSVVLLAVAGLFARTLHNLRSVDLGIDRNHLLLVWTAPGQTGRDADSLGVFVDRVVQRVRELPGVSSASLSNMGPLGGQDRGGSSDGLHAEGQPGRPGLELVRVAVGPGFFSATGTPVLAGRDLTAQDDAAGPKVAVLNETLARFLFGSASPIGKRFGPDDPSSSMLVVGVVKDLKLGTPRDQRGAWFIPYAQAPAMMRTAVIAIQTRERATGALIRQIRQELHSADPSLPVLRIDTVGDQLDDTLAQERLTTALANAFGVVAVVLACVGLYGLISYSTARRTNEIGIRIALGATGWRIASMVMGETSRLVGVGAIMGVAAAAGVTQMIVSRLYGLSGADPLTFVATLCVVALAAAAASYLPARRAARVDVMTALRME